MIKLIKYIKENKHILIAAYVLVYLGWFMIIEHSITDDYFSCYLPIDDKIPFIEEFAIFYIMWYPLLFVPAFYVMIKKDVPAFKRYGYFMMISMSLSLLICTVFPNGQDLRPTSFEDENLFTWIISIIYSADTNTNVLPSMHVVGCVGVSTLVFDSVRTKKWRIPIIVLSVLICLSTVFIKQHSVLDFIAGVVVCIPIWFLIYWKRAKSGCETDDKNKEEKRAVSGGSQAELSGK